MAYYNGRKFRDSNSDTVIGQVFTTTCIGLSIAAAGVHVHMHPSVHSLVQFCFFCFKFSHICSREMNMMTILLLVPPLQLT